MQTDLISKIKAARRVSTPLIAVTTPDPASTIKTITEAVNNGTPAIAWDVVTGLWGVNEQGKAVVTGMITDESNFRDPVAMLDDVLKSMPARCIVFACNLHAWFKEPAVVQAVWNLRDSFKGTNRQLYMLSPSITLPEELSGDVMLFDEELPGDSQLQAIVCDQFAAAGFAPPTGNQILEALPALRGLAAFPAEQVTSMSLRKDQTLDIAGLWDRKRKQIENTPGLRFVTGTETLESVGGHKQIKSLLDKLFTGSRPPKLLIFLDEVEKSMGGSTGGDLSGVSQDQLGVTLKEYDDIDGLGLLMVGPPGTGKSSIAKAVGRTYGVPTIFADFGAAKGSLVGESEARIRQIFKVIKAVGGKGNVLFLATSNRLEQVPPELQRRLGRFGVWMMDLPTQAERKAIWSICEERFGLDPFTAVYPEDDSWTGADIHNCSELAYRTGMTLADASAFLAPVSKSSPEAIERLRRAAAGKFLSTSEPGFYRMPASSVAIPQEFGTSARRITFEEAEAEIRLNDPFA